MKKRLILNYPQRLFLCLMLALLGACDSYNLSLRNFFDGPPADSGKAITAFSITNPVSVTGVINEGAKTIDVTVPYGTPVTYIIPVITHTGASVNPASGEARDFTGPVTYTVTAEDGSTAAYTVTVTVAATLDSITAIGDYLSDAGGGTTKDDPVILPPLNFNLAGGGWADLLDIIASQDPPKFVELDLSACTMDGTEFDPDYTVSTGKDKIVSLVLPDAAESVKERLAPNGAFEYFSVLQSVSGENVETIGGYAFYGCDALTTITFPAATTIGDAAFYDCDALESVSLPAATSIGTNAFFDCDALESVNLPAATSIGENAFYDCAHLETVSLPAATSIGDAAFNGCSGLTSANLPVATSIGEYAFFDCAHLETVNLPMAATIGDRAFNGCNVLESVYLPSATTIGDSAFNECITLAAVNLPAVTYIEQYAFYSCTALISLTLGSSVPPTLNIPFANTGYGVTTRLTIHVPPDRVSAYMTAWGVSAALTAAGANVEKYGFQHKEIYITD